MIHLVNAILAVSRYLRFTVLFTNTQIIIEYNAPILKLWSGICISNLVFLLEVMKKGVDGVKLGQSVIYDGE